MAIVVGDIHGNVEKVRAFLEYKPEEEHIALGDYLDSFFEPQQRQIEALKMLLDSKAVLLWGNHDLHYLKIPPFICTGFQYNREKPLQEIVEANKNRFLAAYAVDGWLLTHAGVHIRIAKHKTDTTAIANLINESFARWFAKQTNFMHPKNGWMIADTPAIFTIGQGRGGDSLSGGIFWYDFKHESGLAPVKQIFGHTETREPVVTDTYIALDTTNNQEYCWLYDTSINELVRLDLPKRTPNYQPMNEEDYTLARKRNSPGRICDLPEEDRESFRAYLRANLCNSPLLNGVPPEEQDRYWPTDYRRWKAEVEARKQHALEHYPRERDLPEEERGPFREWVMGKTRPYVEGIPREEQDFYYEEDYRRWKAGLDPFD